MTSSIRKLAGARVAGALLALAAAGGCARVQEQYESTGHRYDAAMATPRGYINQYVRPTQSRFDPVMADPMPDEATVARNWEPVTQYYANGRVVAGPTYGLAYEDRPKWLRNDYVYSLSQSALILVEAVAMPFWMVVEPPLTRLEYRASAFEPSRTVAPPLPSPVPPRSGDGQATDAPAVPQGPSAPNAPIEPAPPQGPQ